MNIFTQLVPRDFGKARSPSALLAARLAVLIALAQAGTAVAQGNGHALVIGSDLRAFGQASNIRAEGIQGVQRKASLFGLRFSSSRPDMPAEVEVGTIEIAPGARVINSRIEAYGVADGIYVRGGRVGVATVKAW